MSNRSVFRRSDGKWANKRDDASKPASLHLTQKEAIEKAREQLEEYRGGELAVHGRDGRIRSKYTVPPGNDPHRPRDTEH